MSRLALGTATFGREINEAAAFAMMDHAFARGINFFDTAANYSHGVSETIVGNWLALRQPAGETFCIATKTYPPYTPEALEAVVLASAGRLKRQALDILYLHKWDESAAHPSSLMALDSLIATGRVRAIGVSNFSTSQLATVLDLQKKIGLRPFRILQNNNNLAVRHVDAGLVQLCTQNHVHIVTYSPLGAGFLTGKHQDGVQSDSRFAIAPGHQAIYFNPLAADRLQKLKYLARQTGHGMAHLALAWAVHHPDVTSVLIGGRTTAHIDQALAALAFADPAIMDRLNSI